MQFFAVAFFLVLGLCIGSFVNVLIDRLSKGMGVVLKRSFCAHCNTTLSPLELIPLISYISLGGKCKKCKKNIPSRLFYVELFMGFTFAALSYLIVNYFISAETFLLVLILAPVFTAIFFADLIYGIIPDQLLVVIVVVVVAFLLIVSPNVLLARSIAGVSTSALFLFLFLITRGRGMGFGDVKLSFALGLLLGFSKIIVCLYLSFLSGALVSIILVMVKKKSFKGGSIPFGPFLIFSSVISYFWGDQIIKFILQLYL